MGLLAKNRRQGESGDRRMSLAGYRVVITGGSSGIGAAPGDRIRRCRLIWPPFHRTVKRLQKPVRDARAANAF